MGRMQKSIKNISAGLVYQTAAVISSFVVRTLMVRYLGLSVISLNGLYWEIVSMLSLAELGIGSAVVYHLYKPIAENRVEEIKKIMGLYRVCYRMIAAVCFAAGCILTVFIPYIVNGLDYHASYLRFLFFLYVVQVSVSYLFVADTTLLQADQKRYKTVTLQAVMKLVSTILTAFVLWIWKSFVFYLCLTIVITAVTNVLSSLQAQKEYPYLKEPYQPMTLKEAKGLFLNVKDIFIKKVAGYVTNSTDNICISTLAGTIQVGYYSNYAMLFHAVRQIEQQVAGGFSASMGNMAAVEKPEYMDQALRRITAFMHLFGIIMSAGLMACSGDFISLWIGQDFRLPGPVVLVCCVNTYLAIVKEPLWQTMDACGMFHYDKTLAIAGTGINLAVSIILGMKTGMLGIFIGTAVSTLFEIAGKTYGIYHKKLRLPAWEFVCECWEMALSECFALAAAYFLAGLTFVNSFMDFFIKGVISVIVALLSGVLFLGKQLSWLPEIFHEKGS